MPSALPRARGCMQPPAWQQKRVRFVTAFVLVFATIQLCVFLEGGADIFTTIWEAEVRLAHIIHTALGPSSGGQVPVSENNASNIGMKNVGPAAGTTVQPSETAGALDSSSPFVIYEPGRRVVQWTSSSSPLPCNILYIKIPKCASSTSGGVSRRIAARHNISGADAGMENRFITTREPAVSAAHAKFSGGWRAMRKLTKRSFLWTTLRLPVSRCLSFYYFAMYQQKKKISNTGKLHWLRGPCTNYMFRYLKRRGSFDTPESLVGGARAGGVYSFIGLVERYDESMVMLSFLLRIPLVDVLYLKAKDSTTRMVAHPPLAAEDFAVRSYATSAAFNRSNALDYTLYAAASAEFDRRWRLNKEELDACLKAFQEMVASTKIKCSPDKFSGNGGLYSKKAYWRDNGYGYQCLDQNFS